jgi:hypothetical protein
MGEEGFEGWVEGEGLRGGNGVAGVEWKTRLF